MAPPLVSRLLACFVGSLCVTASAGVDSSGEAANGPGRVLQQQALRTSAEVIVVGAGMAGMSAAQSIAQKQGASSVIVLEARNRVGGRCWTQQLTTKSNRKVNVDLGAAWIHGIDASNPMMGLVKAAKVPIATKITDYENAQLYLPNGKEASDAQETRWTDTWDEFEAFIEKKQNELDGSEDDPGVGALAKQFIADNELTGLDRLAFLHNLNTIIEHEYAATAADLSTFFDYDSAEDGDDKFVTGGYQKVVEFLAKGIDVRLNHQVTRIDYSSSKRITLTVAGKGTFTARKVIVAVPAGVLQKNVIQFTPNGLAPANKEALGMLKMGLLNKLIMLFDNVFWDDKNIEVLNRIAPKGDGAWQEFVSMQPIVGLPVLVGFNAGSYALQLEKKTNKQVKDEGLAVLRTMFEDVPEPRSYIVTSWGKDPYSYGSYSFTKAPVDGGSGYKQAHLDTAKPMANNRIFFAGEHTRLDFPATTHGAYLSGQKAVKDLLAAPAAACTPENCVSLGNITMRG